ncbi:hypothetical protein DIPPA_21629 [Diplonema papillatum]|nr:hypothetical protein DIPPA_21629 [Diplonema papillatum]
MGWVAACLLLGLSSAAFVPEEVYRDARAAQSVVLDSARHGVAYVNVMSHILILDISSPRAPAVLSNHTCLPPCSGFVSMTTSGATHLLYAAFFNNLPKGAKSQGVEVISVVDPSAPFSVAVYGHDDFPNKVSFDPDSHHLYYLHTTGVTAFALDRTDATVDPKEAFEIDSDASFVLSRQGLVYVLTNTELNVYEVVSGGLSSRVGSVALGDPSAGGVSHELCAVNNTLLVASRTGDKTGLLFVDVTQPLFPALSSPAGAALPAQAMALACSGEAGGQVLATFNDSVLELFSLAPGGTPPAAPVRWAPAGGSAAAPVSSLALADSGIVLFARDAGLSVVDFSPALPPAASGGSGAASTEAPADGGVGGNVTGIVSFV